MRCRSMFENNVAGELGGALRCSESIMTISSCSFDDNAAGVDGGALCVSYASVVAVDHSRFMGNTGESQGVFL